MKNQKGNLYKNELDAIKERLEECYGDSITFVKNKDYAAAYLPGNNTWRKTLSNIFGYKKFVSKKLPLFKVSEDDVYLQAIQKGQSCSILHEKIHRQVRDLPSYIDEIHANYQMVNFWDENRFKELSTVELLRLYSSLISRKCRCELFKSTFVLFLETKDSSVFGKKIDEAVDHMTKYYIGAALLHDLVSRGMNYHEALLQASKMGKLIKKKLLKEAGYHHIDVEKILITLGIIVDFYLYTLWKEAHHLRITYKGPSFEEWLSLFRKEYTYLLPMTALTTIIVEIFLLFLYDSLSDRWLLYKNLKRAREYKGIRVTELLAD